MKVSRLGIVGALAAVAIWAAMPAGFASQLKLTEGLDEDFAARASTLAGDVPTIAFDFPPLGTVDVLPVRFEPRPGEGSAVASSFRCGLLISIAAGKPQALTTVGVGATETVSCDGVAEVGLVTLKSKEPGLGLIYDFRSPNAEYRGPLVVTFDQSAKRWVVDEASFDGSDAPAEITSLEALRAALKDR